MKSTEIGVEADAGGDMKENSSPASSPERLFDDSQEIPASSRGLFSTFTQRFGNFSFSRMTTVAAAEKKIEEEFEKVAEISTQESESKVCDQKEILDVPPEGSIRKNFCFLFFVVFFCCFFSLQFLASNGI